MEDLSPPPARALSTSAFKERARATLNRQPRTLDATAARAPSDFDLNPDALGDPAIQVNKRPAAVLVGILADPDKPSVLLTQRPDHLTVHAGQISFPGGKVADGDGDMQATALREAHEEVGLERSDVEVLGFLDQYQTATGFLIVPVVGLIQPRFEARANLDEVDEVFTVPLAFLMNPKNHKIDSRVYKQKARKFYAMPYQDRYIWGATAGILRNLYIRLYGS